MTDPKYFEKYFDLFVHPGWTQFMQEVKEVADSINLGDSKDWESFLVMKTKKDTFTYLLQLENVVKLTHENKNADDSL